MAEITTLEQHGITRIQDFEAQAAEKQAQIDALQVKNEELRKILDDLAPYFHIRTNWRGDIKYIWFDGPAKNYNPRFFDELVKLFGLKEEED